MLIAPHFFTENSGIASIAKAKQAYETGDLRGKLARWHADVDNAFKGWNGAWLDPDFRRWDITEHLAYIRVPMLIVQGADDQYGTVKQIEMAEQECYCPVEVALLPGAKHAPQREVPEVTLKDHLRFRRPRAGREQVGEGGVITPPPASPTGHARRRDNRSLPARRLSCAARRPAPASSPWPTTRPSAWCR